MTTELGFPGVGPAKPSVVVAVVLPMYNEAGNVAALLNRLDALRSRLSFELLAVAVNDGSKDDTLEKLEQASLAHPFLVVLRHNQNQGMAAALRTGIDWCLRSTERPISVLAFMDADLTHNPEDLPLLVRPILEGRADFVIGSRYIRGGGMEGVPWIRQAISVVGNLVARILLNVPAADLTSGFRAARAEVFRSISLLEPGFGIQLEGSVKAQRAGFRLAEVPTILGVRKFGYSKMVYNRAFWLGYGRLLWRLARTRAQRESLVADYK